MISAATARSIAAQRRIRLSRMSSSALVPWKSQPQSKSWTNRTPFSTRRRASRQLLAKLAAPGSAPYSSRTRRRLARDVHQLGHDDLHAERQLVLGDPRGRLGVVQLVGLKLVQVFQGIQAGAAKRRGPCLRGRRGRAPGRRRCGTARPGRPRAGSRCPSRSCRRSAASRPRRRR